MALDSLPFHKKLLYRIKNDLHDLSLDEYGYSSYDFHFGGELPLIKACKYGRVNVVKYLVEVQDANIDAQNSLSVETAIKYDQKEIVSYFLEKRFKKKWDHLLIPIKFGYYDLVKLLLESEDGFSNFISTDPDSIIGALVDTPEYIIDDMFNLLYKHGLKNYLSGNNMTVSLAEKFAKFNYLDALMRIIGFIRSDQNSMTRIIESAINGDAIDCLRFLFGRTGMDKKKFLKYAQDKQRKQCIEFLI